MESKPLNILYVEDDCDLVLLVQERLREAGFVVDAAGDGDEALAKYAAGSYDLLAIDQTLPVLDGLGVLRAIAARGPLPPTVMVTGTGNEKLAVQTMKLGADDYIVKDLGGGWLDLLPSVIERVLSQRRLVEDKKAAEAALRERERQLWHAQKLKSLGILAGGIAHDFNNILAGIMGYADLAMVELSISEPARAHIEVVKKAVKRAADLTRQMLAYSGKGKFMVEPIDLTRCVKDLSRMLEVSISKKAVLKHNLIPDLPTIQADASQINQVVMNLIINASEALGEGGGVISISTDAVQCTAQDLAGIGFGQDLAEGPYVRLEVADTGCGMDHQTQAKIFDPFFTTKFTGRGLGLAAVHGIVRGHKGAVRVSSEPGKGTTFQVLFPASDATAPLSSGEPVPAKPWRGTGTVLVVDDEELIRDLASGMIRHFGFSILTASDGGEAIRLYRQHKDEIACVLLDLTMPQMGGDETCRALRRINPDVRVILSSGYNEEGAIERFSGLGLAGFIQKPYEFETMRARLREAVRGDPKHLQGDRDLRKENAVPAIATPLPRTTDKSTTGAAACGRRIVLVADDDDLVCKATRVTFERAGFSVLTANDGEEAVRLYREHRDQIVCVYLDLVMPKMSGQDTLRELRRIDTDVRVVIASGYPENEIARRFTGQEVWGFFQKLEPLDAMITRLHEALGDGTKHGGPPRQ
jgi:CheY-like chemotaxis protein/nitrogen-specific signal transduction histidine kinase